MTDGTVPPDSAAEEDSLGDEREPDSAPETDSLGAEPEPDSTDPDPTSDERTTNGNRQPAEKEPILRARRVDFAYGPVSVLQDVDLPARAGAVTAVVGPNGSGKTTLLRILAGLARPDGGRLEYTDLGGRIGYLPQNPAFRGQFTVAETLHFYADLLETDADVADAIETVGLTDAADRRVDALSGGMVRLLGLAQAVLGDPPVVVLDEPTGDLDPRMTTYIFDVVEDLADRGMAVVLATHNLEGAVGADTVCLLDRGRVVAQGSPSDLMADTGAETIREAFLSLVEGGAEPTVWIAAEGPEGEPEGSP